MRFPQIPKPAYGDACNSCGMCCMISPCVVSKRVFGTEPFEECPTLIETASGTSCGLVEAPMIFAPALCEAESADAVREAVKILIGVGWRCDCSVCEDEPEGYRDALNQWITERHEKITGAINLLEQMA